MADVADHREIYKIAVGMFAAVPGLLYFGELRDAINAGATTQAAYDILTETLAFQAQAPAFNAASSNIDFTNAFLERLLGSDASAAGTAFAIDFIETKLESGMSRGDVIKIAVDALDAVANNDPDFGRAAARFHNRVDFAEHQTEVLNTSSADVHALQALLAVNTSGPLRADSSQSIDVAALPAAGNTDTAPRGAITLDMSGQAQSVLFLGASGNDRYTSSQHGDTIDAAGGADTINLTNAGGVAVAGKTDTLIFSAGDSQLTAAANGHDVINNFGTASGGALDVIDLGAFGFTGQQTSGLANHGALENAVVNGTTLSQAGFFVLGAARAVAIGTNNGDTFVFVDVNKDGNFDASTDLFCQLVGVTDVTLANFGF